MSQHYLVTGAGPVGSTVARQLADAGHTVTLATRSGSGPNLPGIRRIRADVTDAAQLDAAMDGAAAVFHCIHTVYTAKAWRELLPQANELVLAAAGRRGIPVVFPESLYSYSEPGLTMHEDSPRSATGGKRGVRTALLEARAASATATVSVVASDFYGPWVLGSHAGERMLAAVFGGRRLSAVGNPDAPHSFTYVPDLAAAMIRAAQRPELWNRVLHAPTAPAVTQRQLAEAYARAAGLPAPKVSGIPGWVLRVLGTVSGDMRELAELAYQFDKPFVMDSTRSEAELGLTPTPLAEGAAATVAWWRNRQSVPAA
ncbi:NAD-dependent epimerase/dehydratase family protein [Arthrobacter sp. I2-34]|uniref:NAD-dependent epimerase/dehydratase family protein n=1 Tax=Arthrobacter hankyongi TaxID=2904801 RepID=A0ABS9L318_9MICC|nr:NAD-dependent epimerase/dehydratase family protein [Arthrobacter hankyongi]MCG2620887.1 NAD-dependent epimerase/dehydratase family protein [Arthrobacter hankyongi]